MVHPPLPRRHRTSLPNMISWRRPGQQTIRPFQKERARRAELAGQPPCEARRWPRASYPRPSRRTRRAGRASSAPSSSERGGGSGSAFAPARGSTSPNRRELACRELACSSRVFADAGSESDTEGAGSSKSKITQKIPPLYVKRTVRSSTVRHPGTIVVMGDVDAESSVIAGGDVFVWGSLRGSVIAGQGGDYKAKVSALDMRPSSLQIGSVKGNVKRGADGEPVMRPPASRRRRPWTRRRDRGS